jgi:hypothetical protein
MSNSSVGAASSAPPPVVSQPKVDRPNDGDGDAGDATKAPPAAAPAPGTGLVVNKSA